jgi:hypothetical protein
MAAFSDVTYFRFRVDKVWKVPSTVLLAAPTPAPAFAAAAETAGSGCELGTIGTISASTMKGRPDPALRCTAAATSGYFALMSSIFREKMCIRPSAARWICARCPSYL